MHKILLFVLALLLIFGCLPAVGGEQAPLLLTLGDSISMGFGLEQPESQSYGALGANTLGMQYESKAVIGYTAKDLLNRLQKGKLDASIADAKLIVITCGGNDLLNAFYTALAELYNSEQATELTYSDVFDIFAGHGGQLSVSDLTPYALRIIPDFPESEAFALALSEYCHAMFESGGVISYIRSVNAEATLFVANQYNPYLHAGGLSLILGAPFESGIRKLNQAILQASEEGDFYVSDVYSDFAKSEENLCNCYMNFSGMDFDFHPNKEGHALIASRIETSYRQSLVGIAGYQMGQGSLRLVGYTDSIDYDTLQIEVSYVKDDGTSAKEYFQVEKVFEKLYGMRSEDLTEMLSARSEQMPFGYLFGIPFGSLPKKGSTVAVRITAWQNAVMVHRSESEFVFG